MTHRRAILTDMNRDRIFAYVCDVVDAQGGDAEAVEAVLRREFDDEDELEYAAACSVTLLRLYAHPGGSAIIRGMRDQARRLVPAEPRGPRWGWRATG